jgi:hypothetical protein
MTGIEIILALEALWRYFIIDYAGGLRSQAIDCI